MTSKNLKRKYRYALLGVILGSGAPASWLLIKVFFFSDVNSTFWSQLTNELTSSVINITLYLFMGFGTSLVMGCLGYFIGKSGDELSERAAELDQLHTQVNAQKEIFENRYLVLDNNIKNFHQISSRIQSSLVVSEVLSLCAEGLHDILGYERVNILIADETLENLRFAISTGAEDDVRGQKIPLDDRSGIIYKCFKEKKVFIVDDIAKYPEEYHLKPPCDAIRAIRSSNFILCPLVVKGETLGVFGLDNKFSKRALNDTDIDTVKLFANQVASAITRINLLNAIQTLTSELERSFSEILNHREDYSTHVITLESAVNSMSSSTRDMDSAAQGILSAVDETSAAVTEISSAINDANKSLDSLTDASCKSSSAMEQISASLKNIEENTNFSHEVSRQVNAQAVTGHAVVSETAAALLEIQEAVDFSYKGIMRLSENSSRIDSIISVINDITKRTNLLALNASIIAAQAGEYGKSFGVVADEIRNLSIQTGQSTGEITSIIEEILNESRAAADNIAQTKHLVQKGVLLGQNTSESLDRIIESSNKSMAMTEIIKVATREQSSGVSLVSRSISDVTNMTSRIFAVSKEQANATRSIVNAIAKIRKMADEMVTSTSEQVRGSRDIRSSVDGVAVMVHEIFQDLESRKLESASVVKELECMRNIAS